MFVLFALIALLPSCTSLEGAERFVVPRAAIAEHHRRGLKAPH